MFNSIFTESELKRKNPETARGGKKLTLSPLETNISYHGSISIKNILVLHLRKNGLMQRYKLFQYARNTLQLNWVKKACQLVTG
jgi:hypothetical protein